MQTTDDRAEIGVYGGSGFYSLMENPRELWIETPYGAPSERIALGEIAGKRVAF
ncbi:MAG: 5'-methylthioadenosine phosphorylase, partial [Candidatus Eremiobacteraeota bacterium]|nr:5'-methylthioadenosine phosphorylase [Candidatus Eremiobacteraeota bacterium]